MVIKSKTYEGFSQDISAQQAVVLFDEISSLCNSEEHLVFISNLPKDLEKKVFTDVRHHSFSGWQYGLFVNNKVENLRLLKDLWSFSYGTPLYFIVVSNKAADSLDKIKKMTSKLRKCLSGIVSYIFYKSPQKTEVPILLANFNKVALMGHDGETLEIYTDSSSLNNG